MALPLAAVGAGAGAANKVGSLIGSGIAATGGLAQTIYALAAPNPAAKRNRQQLERLLALERQGKLGLSGTQERLMYQRQMDPVRNYAMQQRQNYERMAAASGDQSGAQLARLRQEQGRMVGGAAQSAGLNVAAANEQRRQEQKQEIEARVQAKTQFSADRAAQTFAGVEQMAGAFGRASGSPPNTFSQMTERTGAYLDQLQKDNPDEYNRLMQQAVAAIASAPRGTGG